MAGRKKKLKPSEVVEALQKSHGTITGAAEILGVAYNTIDRYVKASEAARAVIQHWEIRRTDRALYKFDEAMERGEPWAIALQLKDSHEGRKRGYGNRTDVDVTSKGESIVSDLTDEQRAIRTLALLDRARARRVGQAVTEDSLDPSERTPE